MGKSTKKKKWAEEEKDKQYKQDLKNSRKNTKYIETYKKTKIKKKKDKAKKPFICQVRYDCINYYEVTIHGVIQCINYHPGYKDISGYCLKFKIIKKKENTITVSIAPKEIIDEIEKKINIDKKENKIILSFKRNIEM